MLLLREGPLAYGEIVDLQLIIDGGELLADYATPAPLSVRAEIHEEPSTVGGCPHPAVRPEIACEGLVEVCALVEAEVVDGRTSRGGLVVEGDESTYGAGLY